MQLRHISLPLLIDAAGGDPWRINATLRLQRTQLASIAADLENIAAALAETQQAAAKVIAALEIQLQDLDNLIGAYQAQDADISDLEHAAIEETVTVLRVVEHICDEYAAALQAATTTLLNDGYDPVPLHGYDGDSRPTPDQQTDQAAERYGTERRDQDQALVADPGAPAPDRAGAAARLRDDAVVNDPRSDPEARRLAAERLDDFGLACFAGPVPPDLLLGGDARTRARARQEFQQGLEQGRWGERAFTPDEATRVIDAAEQEARVLATRQAVDALIRQAGMTPNGATRFVSDLVNSRAAHLLNDEAGGAVNVIGGAHKGLNATVPRLPTGRHWGPGVAYTAGDLAAIEKLAGRLKGVGGPLGVATSLYDVLVDHKPIAEVAASTLASSFISVQAAGIGAIAFSPLGPPGLFAGALAFGVAGSYGGEWLAGKAFDLARN